MPPRFLTALRASGAPPADAATQTRPANSALAGLKAAAPLGYYRAPMFRDVPTPAFLVDRAVVQRNCDRMREKARVSGVAFRPHVKTHKCVEVGRMQHGGTAGPITVSTLAEAERFADDGFDDITWAFPIAPAKVARAAALAGRVKALHVLVDSDVAAEAVASSGARFGVFLKVDCGYHRAGIDPDAPETLRLAKRLAASPSIEFRGLLTHAGHAYDVRTRAEIEAIANDETSALTRLRDRLDAPRLTRSIGSTPTASVVDRFTDCEEVRPGNYVFYDAFQRAIGSCSPEDVAVSVLATVAGCYPERGSLIVDAGALALSKDRGAVHLDPGTGYGEVCDTSLRRLPLRVIALSQEHGKVAGAPAEIARHPVGALLRIVPNHSCLTAAMFDRYVVVEGGSLVGEWRPVRGW